MHIPSYMTITNYPVLANASVTAVMGDPAQNTITWTTHLPEPLHEVHVPLSPIEGAGFAAAIALVLLASAARRPLGVLETMFVVRTIRNARR